MTKAATDFSKKRSPASSRGIDVLLYFVIAVAIVGTEVIGLMRDWPRPSIRVVGAVCSAILLAVYLCKVFKTQLRLGRFWISLISVLAIHVLWVLVVPFVIVMIGTGVELILFGLLIRHLLGQE